MYASVLTHSSAAKHARSIVFCCVHRISVVVLLCCCGVYDRTLRGQKKSNKSKKVSGINRPNRPDGFNTKLHDIGPSGAIDKSLELAFPLSTAFDL